MLRKQGKTAVPGGPTAYGKRATTHPQSQSL